MYDTNDKNCISREDGQLLTEGELLELDGILLKTNEDIIKKAGEIGGILRDKDGLIQRLRSAYLSAVASLREKDAALEDKSKTLNEEVKAKWDLKNHYDTLQQKYAELDANQNELKKKLGYANQRMQGLEAELSKQEERYHQLETNAKQIQDVCNQHYANARADRDQAVADLRQAQEKLAIFSQDAKTLQERLTKELEDGEARKKDMQDLKDRLQSETSKAGILDEKAQQYAMREQKMPAIMRLYNAYSSMMERRNALPEAFFERIQSVVPLDDFDSFVPRVLKPSFPISYYLSVQSFMAVCSHSGQVSGGTIKEALRVSDDLLSAVFDFGSEYFKEEKLVRIDRKAGDQFDSYVCKYIDGNGGMYGNIVRVWLQGFRDEKNNKIYCSYVEGE